MKDADLTDFERKLLRDGPPQDSTLASDPSLSPAFVEKMRGEAPFYEPEPKAEPGEFSSRLNGALASNDPAPDPFNPSTPIVRSTRPLFDTGPVPPPAPGAPVERVQVGVNSIGDPIYGEKPKPETAPTFDNRTGKPYVPDAAPEPTPAPAAQPLSAAPAGDPRSELMMPAAPRFIAAHHDNSLIPFRQDTQRQMFQNVMDRGAAEQDEQRAVQAQNTIQADKWEEAADQAEARRADRMVAENEHKAVMAERRAKVDKLSADVASGKVDPNRLYANVDTGTRIMMIIGSALGGIGGGPNPMLDMIQSNIKTDMQAQLDGKRKALDHERGMLGELRDEFGDTRSAMLANEHAAWTNVQTRIKAQMDRATDPILKARAQQMLVGTNERLTDIQKQLDVMSYVAPRYQGGGAGPTMGKGLVVKLPDGRQVLAPNEQKFNELTTKSAQVSNIQANIDKALALRKGANVLELGNPMSSVHKQLASLQSETAQMVTVARGQGAMSKGDQEVADAAIGSMTGLLGNNDDVLRSTRTRFGDQLQRDADSLGAEHVETGYQYDAHGRLQRDVALVGASDKPKPNRPKAAGGK